VISLQLILVAGIVAATYMADEIRSTWANAGIPENQQMAFLASPAFLFVIVIIFMAVVAKEFYIKNIRRRLLINGAYSMALFFMLYLITAYLVGPILDAANQA